MCSVPAAVVGGPQSWRDTASQAAIPVEAQCRGYPRPSTSQLALSADTWRRTRDASLAGGASGGNGGAMARRAGSNAKAAWAWHPATRARSWCPRTALRHGTASTSSTVARLRQLTDPTAHGREFGTWAPRIRRTRVPAGDRVISELKRSKRSTNFHFGQLAHTCCIATKRRRGETRR